MAEIFGLMTTDIAGTLVVSFLGLSAIAWSCAFVARFILNR